MHMGTNALFKKPHALDANPLLRFCAPLAFDEIQTAHIGAAIDQLLADARSAMRVVELASACDWESIVAPISFVFDRLQQTWNVVTHLLAVADTSDLRNACNEALPQLSAFAMELGQNSRIYEQYKKLATSSRFATYSPARKRAVEKMLQQFHLAGVDLPDERRREVASLRMQLSELCARYDQNLCDATHAFSLDVDNEATLAGIPLAMLHTARAHAQELGRTGWTLSLQTPCVWGVLNHAHNRALREKIYRAYTTRCSEFGPDEMNNTQTATTIFRLRSTLAAALGFDNYAQCVLSDRMVVEPFEATAFLRGLSERARAAATAERLAMERFAREQLGIDVLQPWDAPFVAEQMKEGLHGITAEELSNYFPEAAVLTGLFKLLREVFGVILQPGDNPVWHSDVRYFCVLDESGAFIGDLYLDLYERQGKRGGTWVSEGRSRSLHDGEIQTPVVFLCCNVAQPDERGVALFSHDDLVLLFHEVGHCLHFLLTMVDEIGVSGTSGVEWDAIELPSQLMEQFAWDWRSLVCLSEHIETRAPIPKLLFDRMLAARNFQYGLTMMRQIEFALIDMELHTNAPTSWEQALRVTENIRAEIGLWPAPAYNRFLTSFPHIFGGGYAAGYYTYLWSEVMSADAYAAFREPSVDLSATGRRFRREILAMGGARPIVEGFRAFRGRQPDPKAFLCDRNLM